MPQLTIDKTSIHYISRGQGAPIILLHPPALCITSFGPLIEQLSLQHRVIALDFRGHGKSMPSGTPLTYPLIVEDIAALMNHLSIQKAYLCGYSTGGSIVLEFLLSHPERACGGILVGAMPEVDDLRLALRILSAIQLAKLGAISALALSITCSNSKWPWFWKTFRDARRGNKENIRQYYEYSLKFNCTNRLSNITAPVLLVYGEKDKGFQRYAKLLQERLVQSELVWIPSVKHQIPTKATRQLVSHVTRFIESREN